MANNNLIHSIDVNNEKVNTIIKIRINDECKNGHQDFGITATFWQIGKVRNDRNCISGGCCHEEILKLFPKLEIFVNLHLCDYKGVPMYVIENGLYHITKGFERLEGKTQKEYFCKYYRITSYQYDALLKATEKEYFGFLLDELGILKQWEIEANEAISVLEKFTGEEFLVDSVKSQFNMTSEKLDEIRKLVNEGYFTDGNISKRKDEAKQAKIQKEMEDLNKEFAKSNEEIKIDYALKKIAIELQLPKFGFIHYKHLNEIVFNWNNQKEFTENDYKMFVSRINDNRVLRDKDFKLTFKSL